VEHKKTGRPSKGDRRMIAYKLPTHLIEATREHAARRGITVTDLIGELLAAEVGVPYMDQEALPLDKSP
jgi:predicted DNA binding CopG/RHH family protein